MSKNIVVINKKTVPVFFTSDDSEMQTPLLTMMVFIDIIRMWLSLKPQAYRAIWDDKSKSAITPTVYISWDDAQGQQTLTITPVYDGVNKPRYYRLAEIAKLPGLEITETTQRYSADITIAQKTTLQSLSDPFIKFEELTAGDENNTARRILALEVKGDNHVALYTIQPDGDYIVESLIGINQGWERYDSEGYRLNEDGTRASQLINSYWA